MGWFYSFHPRLTVHDQGEILACQLTPGKVDDRKPLPHRALARFSKLCGDKGYVSLP